MDTVSPTALVLLEKIHRTLLRFSENSKLKHEEAAARIKKLPHKRKTTLNEEVDRIISAARKSLEAAESKLSKVKDDNTFAIFRAAYREAKSDVETAEKNSMNANPAQKMQPGLMLTA